MVIPMIHSLYIHIPFCHTICSYCDFVKMVSAGDYMDQYLDQLVTEIHHYAPSLQQIQTVFIGGGTPSILSIPQTKRLLGLLQELGLLLHVREYISEEISVGKECKEVCISRWSPYH